MKNIKSFLFLGVALVALAFAAVLIPVQPAHAQTAPTRTGTLTLAASNAAATTTNTITSSAIDVPQGRALALFPTFNMASASTGSITWNAQVSYDGGTTWTTSSGLSHTVAANGTSTVVSYWLLDPTELNAVSKIRLSTVANTNAVNATNFVCVYSTQAL